jgi:putative hemolysin
MICHSKLRWNLIVFGITVLILEVAAIDFIREPSSVYCEQMGYEFVLVDTEEGQIGVCRFNEGENATSLDFLTGKAGGEYSYCARRGLEMKTIADPEKCSIPFSRECAVCVLEDGTEVEVTELMEKEKAKPTTTTLPPTTTLRRKPVCGDGVCERPETKEGCPEDCGMDATPLVYGAGLLILIAVVWALLRQKKG